MARLTHVFRATALLLVVFCAHANNSSDQVKITSDQQIIMRDHYIFKKNVELLIHGKYHILADTITVDAARKNFIAKGDHAFAVKIETEKLLIYARSCTYDRVAESAKVYDATLHLQKGYITAASAERRGNGVWRLEKALYTPCDADNPHWRLTARSVVLHDDSVDACKAEFLIGEQVLAYVPRIVVPFQGKSKTGFLLPKLSLYSRGGVGIKQDYYWYLGKHADCTAGIDWQQHRGIFATGNIRWAHSPDEFMLITGHAGRAWHAFVQKKDMIVEEARNRYWVQGKDFRQLGTLANFESYALTQADFGSDKKIGYQFFDSINDVDDTFFNSSVVRGYNKQGVFDVRFDAINTSRNRFSELVANDRARIKQFLAIAQPQDPSLLLDEAQQKVLENRLFVGKLPHVEYNSGYTFWANVASYRHDIFADRLSYQEYETEKIYALSRVALEEPLIPRNSTDMLRFEYRGVVREHFRWLNQSLTMLCYPHYQMRSKINSPEYYTVNTFERRFAANGGQRAFLEYAAEWCLPEVKFDSPSSGYSHYMQPIVTWGLLPKIYQRHWYAVDKWDFLYPKHEIACSLRNNIKIQETEIDWYVTQGYDFYKNYELFPLRRSISGSHLLPINNFVAASNGDYGVSNELEYDVRAGNLLYAETNVHAKLGSMDFAVGHLYWNNKAQERKKLLSNIPHFVFLQGSLSLNKYAKLHYGGRFSVEQGSLLRPLIHQLKFEYGGHCWGFYLGVEEKLYRESGISRRDQLIVFSIHFDSLGSLGKKFKSPYFAI